MTEVLARPAHVVAAFIIRGMSLTVPDQEVRRKVGMPSHVNLLHEDAFFEGVASGLMLAYHVLADLDEGKSEYTFEEYMEVIARFAQDDDDDAG